MDIVNEFDKMLHRAEVEEYTDDPVDWGRIGALREGRELVMSYVKHRQAADEELCVENTALREEIEEMRQRLGRDILGLVAVPEHLETKAIVDQSVAAYTQTRRERDSHECDCDCSAECDCEANGECYQDCDECSDV